MRSRTTRTLLILILALGLLVCFVGLAMADFSFANLQTGGAFETRSFSTEETVASLSVDADEAEIRIVRAESGEGFRVEYEENSLVKFTSAYADGVFSLTSVKIAWYRRIFTLGFKTPLVTLRLPGDSYERLSLRTRNGDISGETPLTAAEAYLKTNNGKVNVKNLTLSGNLTVESSNGALNLENIAAAGITGETSNGKIYAAQLTAADISLKSSNGAVKALGLDAARSVSLKTSNGRIAASVAGSAQDYRISAKTSNGSSNLADTSVGEKSLTVKTSNGDIDVSFLG